MEVDAGVDGEVGIAADDDDGSDVDVLHRVVCGVVVGLLTLPVAVVNDGSGVHVISELAI